MNEEQNAGSYSPENKNKLREIERTIVAIVIFSADGKILMGKKDPAKGGVYPNAWHIPGGGTEDGESLEAAMVREANQEVLGLGLVVDQLKKLDEIGHGESQKTLDTGEVIWCKMEFNHFEVHLKKLAAELESELAPGDDLVELHWFSPEEFDHVEQIPGGHEFFVSQGYIHD